ncbi:Uma2 family endonuclease [Pseudanabaenaceae cyanobacterium LEGE 13415]|nr:Uma2 family endonuclease [Pseudanabaenaceae cyanobacterium LEGE 13415]
MTQAKLRFNTSEEYLAYDDGTDIPYELVNGVLVRMGAENPRNVAIAIFLISVFLRLPIPHYLIHRGTEIAVSSSKITSRIPDLMILTEAGWAALMGTSRAIVTSTMPAPALVVEVVSPREPGSNNYDCDYIQKRCEYAERGILEYWLIDPGRNSVIVLQLDGTEYRESGRFQNDQSIVSPTFPTLELTANQILQAGQ